MIVKLQLPLSSTTANPGVLAYDKSRKFMVEIPVSPELKELFGPKVKIYCEAHVEKDKLVVDSKVADQSW